MTDINLKTLTPDTSLPTTGFLFGADSQASTNPSVYSTQTVATTLLGSTSLTGDVLTASAPVLNLTQQWNSVGTTFTGLKFNVDTTTYNQSAAASLLMDLQVGGVSKFNVNKSGQIRAIASSLLYLFQDDTGTYSFSTDGNGGVPKLSLKAGNVQLFSGGIFGFGNGANSNGSIDTILTRKGERNLQLGNADAATALAQTLSVQSVVAGTSSTAGADFTLTGSQNTGSGLAGNLIVSTGFSNTVGTATVTITIATPGVITWTAHGLVTGSPVVFTTTGALPTGITAGTTYFAITSSTLGVNTFQIATSAANAAAGTAVATSGTQSGVQTGTTSATVQSPLMTTTTFGPSGLTGSQAISLLDLKQTWNTSGAPTALKLNIIDTASANGSSPFTIQFNGVDWLTIKKPGQGGLVIGNTAATGSLIAVNSVTNASTTQIIGSTVGGLLLSKDQRVSWQSTAQLSGSDDLFLIRKGVANLQLGAADAASAVPQTLSVQSVVAGAITNPAGADFTITGSQGLGSGAGGSIIFKVAPAGTAGVSTQNALAAALTIDSTKQATFAGSITASTAATTSSFNDIKLNTTRYLYWTSSTQISAPSDGVLTLQNSASTSFGRLQFGGTTSSFPALKQSTTTLQTRLADDSAFAAIQGKLTTDNAYTAGTVVQTGYVTIYDSTGTAYKVLVGA